ncbi:MAG: helix-turn-helix domain-containing protein [Chitinispirillales bacterium]|jgi:AraC-like DNA-binding protein|nr:helix-turn-helix domain-containing protein [Chitinispirillales bacterium]
MEKTYPKLLLTVMLILCSYFSIFGVELIILKRHADSAEIIPAVKTIITADSARIVSPSVRSILKSDIVVYEIEPLRKVDSVILFVHHSQREVDTLGVFTSPPYRAVWNCASVADQDQIHLQFGYTLFYSDSLIINSPPLPHRWVLDRGKKPPSKQSYRIMETTKPDHFTIDCDLSKWKDVESVSIGDFANFKLLWTSAKLFFIAEVKGNPVTANDFIELHADLRRNRSSFAGINHRTIRFSPRSRSNSFVAELNDSGGILSDSVSILITKEMEWKKVIDSNGYIIEAIIPFFVLSDKEFPPSKFGFDVSLMRTDETGKQQFYSWADAEQFNRYSPKSWGTARLSQAWFALKAVFVFLAAVTILILVLTALHTILQKRKSAHYEKTEAQGFSPLLEMITGCIEEHLSSENFCLEEALKIVNQTEEKVTTAIRQELDCDFDQLLSFRRLRRAQSLMRNPDLDINSIAVMSGFGNASVFIEQYKICMNVDPETCRAASLKQIMEEAEDDDE